MPKAKRYTAEERRAYYMGVGSARKVLKKGTDDMSFDEEVSFWNGYSAVLTAHHGLDGGKKPSRKSGKKGN